MRVHHIDCATLCPVSARLMQGEGGWLEPGRLVCHCWLVEASDGLVLVDTGLGTDDLRDPSRRLGAWFPLLARPVGDPSLTALRQIEAFGYRAADVHHIVPTHLDLDHAGGLPDFPEAEVHVFRPEHVAATRPRTLRERSRYRQAHWQHRPRWVLHELEGERWFGFEAVRTIDRSADLLLVPLVGHTRGHCGVAVRTQEGWLLHAGDAYFHHGEMAASPSCPVGLRAFQRVVAMNDRARRANQQRLRSLVQTRGAEVTVHSAHCPVEYDQLSGSGAAPGRRSPARPARIDSCR